MMIVGCEEDLPVGHTGPHIVTDRDGRPHRIMVRVIRRATLEEWEAYVRADGGDPERIPIYHRRSAKYYAVHSD